MGRLIDADALLKKVQFRKPIDSHDAEVIGECVKITRRIIDGEPTIDPVHHAGGCYCRECIHRTDTGKCGHPRHDAYPMTYPNDFCNYGHRLEDDDG